MQGEFKSMKFRCNTPSSTSECRKVLNALTKNVIEENNTRFPTKMDFFQISPDRFTCFFDVKRHINNLPEEWVNDHTFVNFYVEFEGDVESLPIYTIRIFKISDEGKISLNCIEDFLNQVIPVYPKILLSKRRKEFLKYIGVYVPFVDQIMSLILEKVRFKNGVSYLKLIDLLSQNELYNDNLTSR